MARKENPNKTQTTIMIDKTLKKDLNKLRNRSNKRKGNESDNDVISRIIKLLKEQYPNLFHEPTNTYDEKLVPKTITDNPSD